MTWHGFCFLCGHTQPAMKALLIALAIVLSSVVKAQSLGEYYEFMLEMGSVSSNYNQHGEQLYLLHFKELRYPNRDWENPFWDTYSPEWWKLPSLSYEQPNKRITTGALHPISSGPGMSIGGQSYAKLDSAGTYRLFEITENDTSLSYEMIHREDDALHWRSTTHNLYSGEIIRQVCYDTLQLTENTFQTSITFNTGGGWELVSQTHHKQIVRRGKLKKEVAELKVRKESTRGLIEIEGTDQTITYLHLRVIRYNRKGLIKSITIKQLALERMFKTLVRIRILPESWSQHEAKKKKQNKQ